jgi:hypothetical protein
MGHPIRIGGVQYDTGLAAHSGCSIVYQLSGRAQEFSAVLGIDDEEHPSDKKIEECFAEMVILLDHKEAFRRKVYWKQKGVPCKLDLRGKHQLELQAWFGAGFTRQRVAFADARIQVDNKQPFLAQAEKWQQAVLQARSAQPEYPAAPTWKQLKIRKIKYRHWDNAYEISNPACRLMVVPEFGGRILSFSLTGGENLLYENPHLDLKLLHIRGADANCGGHFSRLQPRNYFTPSDPVLVSCCYDIAFPKEGEVVMTSQRSMCFGVQIEYHITIDPVEPKIRITTVHKNTSEFSHEAGVWSITRLKPFGTLMMPPEAARPPRPAIFEPAELFPVVQIDPVTGWQNLDTAAPQIQGNLGSKFKCIQWQCFPQTGEICVRLPSGVLYRKIFEYQTELPGEMGEFFPAHFYMNQQFIEAESHGPILELAPKDEISFTETWVLQER